MAPVQSGDPDFVPGSVYKGEKLTFRKTDDAAGQPAVGMWVWDCRMIRGTSPDSDMSSDMLLDMLIQNGVTGDLSGYAVLHGSGVADRQ